MKTKELKITFIVVIFLIFAFFIPSYAVDDSVYSVFDESGAYSLFDSLDENTKEYLRDLGVEELSADQIFQISPKKVVSAMLDVVSLNFSDALKVFFNILIILLFQAISQSIINEEKGRITDIVFTLLITTAATVPAFNSITLAASQIMTSAGFMISFIPVYAFIMSSSGNITQSISFNTLLFTASQFILQFAQSIIIPLSGVLMSINIASAINPVLPLESLTKAVKKAITVLLAFISTVFIGFLSFKGTIASDVDALTVRSIRTVSGAVVPVIGSSVADAYSSVLGSLKLINSCFGSLGIIIILIINLPVVIELLLYYFTFYFASVTAQMLKCESSKLLENIASVISIINTVLIFVSICFTVSIGIMLKARVG